MEVRSLAEREGDEPLYVRLRERIADYITQSEVGDRLPSERVLAEAAGVNRATVRNAIKDFVRKGILKREKGRRGTIIAAKLEEASEHPNWHPLQTHRFPEISPKRTNALTLSLYEDLPNQKRFWSEAVDDFNAQQSNVSIVIDWVNHSISERDEYLRYVRKNQPDIFLVDDLACDLFMENGILREIPEGFRAKLEKSRYYNTFFADNIRNRYSLPLHFSPRIAVWNLDLAQQLGIAVPDAPCETTALLNISDSVADTLSGDLIATGNIWDLMVSLGFPETERLELAFFRKRLSLLAPFAGRHKHAFSVSQKHYFQAMEKFVKGEMLFFVGNVLFALQFVDRFPFRFGGTWLLPEKNLSYSENCSRVAVYSEAGNAGDIWAFLESLYSKKNSRRMLQRRMNCSYRKSANVELEKTIPGLTAADIDRLLDRYSARVTGNPAYFFTFGIRDLYRTLMDEELDVETAAAEAFRMYKGRYYP